MATPKKTTKKKLSTKDLKKVTGGAAKPGMAGPTKISQGRTAVTPSKASSPLSSKR